MAYTKTSWQTGDVVTSEKLNHAEDGIEAANQNTLPAVTSDDNGDVLTVVEGAWAKAGPPSGLPAVTSDDNGDVLTVVEGAWAKAAPAGTDGFYIVQFGFVDNGYVCNRTFAEIKAVLEDENGSPVIATYDNAIASSLTTTVDGTAITAVNFHFWVLPTVSTAFAHGVMTMDANGITVSYTMYELTPVSNG